MNLNVIVVLSSLAIARASNSGPAYLPASSVSYSSFSSGTATKTTSATEKTIVAPLPYKKVGEPAPIYENNGSSSYGTLDGKTLAFTKAVEYSGFNTFDNSHIHHSIPAYSSIHANPIVYHPDTSYSLSSPVYHTISAPVAKHVSIPLAYTHSSPLVKTISAPLSYSTPIVAKTKVLSTPALSTFSHTPLVGSHDVKTITYSDAPVVSHVSFSGLGAEFAW